MNNITQQYLPYTSDCQDCGKKSCDSLYNNNVIPTYNNNVCTNSGFNFGVSSRLQYDNDYIHDDITQSVAPIMSTLDPNRVKNCNQCLSLNGPRASHNGWGDSIPIPNPTLTPAQDLVDIDSIMSNRNVKQDRSKKGKVNTVDVFKFKTYDAKLCDRGLDPLSSILTYPKQLYREMSINRFYDLNINPQTNIYWDGAVNSQLEAKDNYDYPYPYLLSVDETLPKTINGKTRPCKTTCTQNCDVNVYDNRNIKQELTNSNMYYTDSESESESD